MGKLIGQFYDHEVEVDHETFSIGPYKYNISDLDEVAKNLGMTRNQRDKIYTAYKEEVMKASADPNYYFDESRVAIPEATNFLERTIPLLAKSRWIRQYFFYGREGLSVRVTAYLAKNSDATGQFLDHPSPVVRYQIVDSWSKHHLARDPDPVIRAALTSRGVDIPHTDPSPHVRAALVRNGLYHEELKDDPSALVQIAFVHHRRALESKLKHSAGLPDDYDE